LGARWPGFAFGWWVVLEGDLEMDLDVPARDADFLDDEAQQALAAVEVEFVERGEDAFCQLIVGEQAVITTTPANDDDLIGSQLAALERKLD
jgi:hypothetical protein